MRFSLFIGSFDFGTFNLDDNSLVLGLDWSFVLGSFDREWFKIFLSLKVFLKL